MVDQDDKDPEAVLAESGSEGAASEEVSAKASSSEGGEAVETVEASEADALEEAPAASEGTPEPSIDAPKETEGAESLSAASVSALLDAAETANDVAQAAERMDAAFRAE